MASLNGVRRRTTSHSDGKLGNTDCCFQVTYILGQFEVSLHGMDAAQMLQMAPKSASLAPI